MWFPVLNDPKARYLLFTDASDVGVAGVLMQEQYDSETGTYVPRTISNFAKTLNDTQRRWAIYEKESYAMLLSVTNFRKYLLGS